MTVRVVEEVPGSSLGTVWRGIVVLLGVVLLIVGILAAPLPLMLVVVTLSDLAQGNEITAMSREGLRDFLITAVVAVLAWWLGLRLIRGRRRVGLYLRKFGFADTTRTVSHALTSAVGRSVRLVTLDDSMVAPIGAGQARRRVAGLVWFLAVLSALFLLYYIFGGGYDADARSLVDQTADQADGLAASIVAVIVGTVVGVVFLIVVMIIVVIAALIAMLGGGSYLAARRAERGATQTLRDQRDVDTTARRIARLGRRIFAPRLVVIAVPTAFWQRAVHGLAAVSDVLVIDVSQPTDALVWEVQNIKPLFHGRLVLVGARDRVAALARPETPLNATPLGLVARMLDGEEVLAYGSTPEELRRFARSLRHKLAQTHRR